MRGDEVGNNVRDRLIEIESNLVYEKARYHPDCFTEFFKISDDKKM